MTEKQCKLELLKNIKNLSNSIRVTHNGFNKSKKLKRLYNNLSSNFDKLSYGEMSEMYCSCTIEL